MITLVVALFGRSHVTEKWCDIKLASSWYEGMMLLQQVLEAFRLRVPCLFMVKSDL